MDIRVHKICNVNKMQSYFVLLLLDCEWESGKSIHNNTHIFLADPVHDTRKKERKNKQKISIITMILKIHVFMVDICMRSPHTHSGYGSRNSS